MNEEKTIPMENDKSKDDNVRDLPEKHEPDESEEDGPVHTMKKSEKLTIWLVAIVLAAALTALFVLGSIGASTENINIMGDITTG